VVNKDIYCYDDSSRVVRLSCTADANAEADAASAIVKECKSVFNSPILDLTADTDEVRVACADGQVAVLAPDTLRQLETFSLGSSAGVQRAAFCRMRPSIMAFISGGGALHVRLQVERDAQISLKKICS
jgi:hypothetical protein